MNPSTPSDAVGRGAIAGPDIVVVGPAPPLRGGIAAHTARLVEALRAEGRRTAVLSYRRLYPSLGFPGRSQRVAGTALDGSVEVLDVVDPRTWSDARDLLVASGATVVLQWWHPVLAPALLGATRGLARGRVVAICHNLLPHERLPGARAAARLVLARAGRIVCHASAEAEAVRALLPAADVRMTPLPCLLPAALLAGARERARAGAPRGERWVVAAGHVRPYKAVDVLLEAWLVARRPPEARLLVVGESYLRGRARRAILGLAGRDRSIVLEDRYVADAELVQRLSWAEVLVAAHRRASQSGIVPLARELGLRAIVSDAGELAAQAGEGADVVPAGDVAALAAALERAFERPASLRPPAEAAREAALPSGTTLEHEAPHVAVRQHEDARWHDEAPHGFGWRSVIEAIGAAARPSSRSGT